jgi:hypothetical protein
MLINIASRKALVSHVSVRDSHNMYGGSSKIWKSCFPNLCHQDSTSLACRDSVLPGASGPVGLMEDCLSQHTREQVLVAQRNLEKAWEPIGSPIHQTGKNLDSNNRHAFGRQKGSLITSQRPPSNPVWGETGSLRFREWGKSV